MEETLSLILQGCKLAGNLESNLPNLSNQPLLLSNFCEEIVTVFRTAKDRLHRGPSFVFDHGVERNNELEVAVQEWLRSSMEPVHSHGSSGQVTRGSLSSGFGALGSVGMEMDNVIVQSGRGEGMSGLGKSPVVVGQRTRKRKEGVEQRTVRVATPRMGNTEVPPDDGFTWRKYGQKEILGSMFPRGYYRCTHKTFYGCDAKKYVQRLDQDPNMFEITYYGHHTCHISSQTISAPSPSTTAPSTNTIVHQGRHLDTSPPDPSSVPLHRWLTELHVQTSKDFHQLGESGNVGSTDEAGPSNVENVKDNAEFPVRDLADAMFNSGGSSNSLDSIFPSSMQEN